jgi:very-short-patch-repair endonuclease
LVIEIDGEIHKSKDQKEHDIGREAELERWDIMVIRFTNKEIESDIELIQRKILQLCTKRQAEYQSPL